MISLRINQATVSETEIGQANFPSSSCQMLYRMLSRLWLAVWLVTFLVTEQVFAETAKYYIVDNSEEGTVGSPRLSDVEDLFVSVGGNEYLISDADLQNYYHKSIYGTDDLDGDGKDEVILEMHHGGNCCGYEYAVVSERDDNFFSIIRHEVFSGATFPNLELVKINDEKLLKVINRSEGVDNTSQSLTISLLKFEHGQLTLLSQSNNAALLPTLVEVNSFEFDKEETQQIIRQFDADGDEEQDQLICDYWARWGSVVCEVDSSAFGYQSFSIGCDRFGVLQTSSNGMKDLVCNNFSKYVFDGDKYLAAPNQP